MGVGSGPDRKFFDDFGADELGSQHTRWDARRRILDNQSATAGAALLGRSNPRNLGVSLVAVRLFRMGSLRDRASARGNGLPERLDMRVRLNAFIPGDELGAMAAG